MGQGKKKLEEEKEEEEEEAPHFLKGGMEAEQQQKSEHQAPEEFSPVYTVQRMYLLKLHVCRYFS